MIGLLLRRLKHGYEGDGKRAAFTPSTAAQLVIGLALLIFVCLRVSGVHPSARALGMGATAFLLLAIAAAVITHRRTRL